ncbi:MAG: YebC/PmpR family DNA-binding transcriptional regulator [Gammaproteobacteria bacterium]|nr:YebC/PmpR family DNA-binding transcriptional regulator [Gammaproteobacteria bacterium]
MSGHSKWANIKHRKGKQDAVKGKIFTKLIRAITVAARKGGGNVDDNPALRLAVDKALGHNMPRDTIDRAIKRGAGNDEDSKMEETHFEGYGPGGVAILVYCLTDNHNRTVADVRYAFTKHGGNLGTDGSVGYLFKQSGLICFAPGSNEDKIMQIALEVGAEDVVSNSDGSVDVITSPEVFSKAKTALEKDGLTPAAAEVTMLANTTVPLNKEAAEKVLSLLDALEELDDVQNVFSNADMPEEVLG